ncbi:hypothetical protein ACYTTR_02125 [Cobetia marina]
MSQQPLDAPALRVVEITQGGKRVPFPTLDWADGPAEGEVGIASIIGVHSDRQGVVWMLDMGSQDSAPKLVGWDTRSDSLKKVIPLCRSPSYRISSSMKGAARSISRT